MDILVSPFEVMNYTLISQLFFDYEQVLEKINYSFVYVEVVELGDHRFLVFQLTSLYCRHWDALGNDLQRQISLKI